MQHPGAGAGERGREGEMERGPGRSSLLGKEGSEDDGGEGGEKGEENNP